jgi:intergrase/recombinase
MTKKAEPIGKNCYICAQEIMDNEKTARMVGVKNIRLSHKDWKDCQTALNRPMEDYTSQREYQHSLKKYDPVLETGE